VSRIAQQEDINFLLTNRLPRRLVTRFMGWFSKIRNPLIRDLSIWCWKVFSPDLDLSEARKNEFDSLHDCFIREIKPGSRQINMSPDIVVSPCDAIIGEIGKV
jgi:phosphatidylserine decarboxylase